MSKADRILKVSRGNNSQTFEDDNSTTLPRIETKRSFANPPDTYNFVNNKTKSSNTLPGIYSKELLGSLSPQERSMVEELSRKLEDQRKEIDQRNQNLMAVQRNFEGISAMLKKEKDLGADNKKKVAALTEENQKVTEENRLLGKRIEDMIDRLNKYEHELDYNAKDKKRINQSLEEQDALKSKIQDLQRELDKKKKDIIDLDTKNRGLQTQIDKFKKAALGLEEDKQKSFLQFKEAKNELIMLHTENDRLHKIIVEYKVRAGDFDKLNEEYKALLVKKSELEKENKEYLKEIADVRSEITNLKNHNKKLEESLQSQNFQLKFGNSKEESLREEIKELKRQVELLENEIAGLKVYVGELEKNSQEDKQYYSSYKSLIDRYNSLSRDGDEISLIKKTELDKLNNEFSRLKERQADYEEIKKRMDILSRDMTKKNEMIERCISDKQFEEEKSNKLNERIRALEEENRKCNAHNQKLLSALSFKNENDRVKDVKFNDEIESLKQKLDANITSFGDINTKHRNTINEKDSLAKQVETLKKDVEDRNKEIQILKDKIQSLLTDKDSADLESNSDKAQLKRELANLNDQLKNLREENSALNKQIEGIKILNKTKDEEISQLKLMLDGLTQGNKSSSQSLQALQKEIKELKTNIEICENQIESLKKTNSSLTSEVALRTEECREAQKKIADNQEQHKILSTINDNLISKNNELSSTLRHSADELAEANSRLKQSKSSFEELEKKYNDALNKISELDEGQFKAKLAQLEERENQFNKVIAKMDHAQSSLLISLSCCECMDHLKNPVTLLPCGHNYCEKCVPKGNSCKECGAGKENEYTFKNKLLGDVIAKVSYNQVILESLKPTTNR